MNNIKNNFLTIWHKYRWYRILTYVYPFVLFYVADEMGSISTLDAFLSGESVGTLFLVALLWIIVTLILFRREISSFIPTVVAENERAQQYDANSSSLTSTIAVLFLQGIVWFFFLGTSVMSCDSGCRISPIWLPLMYLWPMAVLGVFVLYVWYLITGNRSAMNEILKNANKLFPLALTPLLLPLIVFLGK